MKRRRADWTLIWRLLVIPFFRRRGCSPSKKSKRSVEVENYGIVWWADFCVGYSLPMLCLYAFRGIPFGTLNAGDVSISILPAIARERLCIQRGGADLKRFDDYCRRCCRFDCYKATARQPGSSSFRPAADVFFLHSFSRCLDVLDVKVVLCGPGCCLPVASQLSVLKKLED